MNCKNCMWFHQFASALPHDISDMGCKHPKWAGYISDPSAPSCGGLAFHTHTILEHGDDYGN